MHSYFLKCIDACIIHELPISVFMIFYNALMMYELPIIKAPFKSQVRIKVLILMCLHAMGHLQVAAMF